MLKLVAWQDRPEMREKDAVDVWNLLAVYFDLITNEIYTAHSDLFDEDNTMDTTNSTLLIGARVMGRQVRQLLAARPVQTRLVTLLADQLALGERSPLARAMSRQGPELDTCLAMLAALQAGVKDFYRLVYNDLAMVLATVSTGRNGPVFCERCGDFSGLI